MNNTLYNLTHHASLRFTVLIDEVHMHSHPNSIQSLCKNNTKLALVTHHASLRFTVLIDELHMHSHPNSIQSLLQNQYKIGMSDSPRQPQVHRAH